MAFIERFARKTINQESEESEIRNRQAFQKINLSENKREIFVTPRSAYNASFETQKSSADRYLAKRGAYS